MGNDYWKQSAKLLRAAGGMAIAPDPPIWADAAEVAHGTLSDMVYRWGRLPSSHQQFHTIAVDGGALDISIIEGLLSQPRYETD